MQQRVKRFIQHLGDWLILESVEIGEWKAKRAIYEDPETYRFIDQEETVVRTGDWLADSGMTIFLRRTVEIPEAWGDRQAGLVFRAGENRVSSLQEGLVRLDGVPYHGLDRNRSYVPFPANRGGKRTYDISIELFNYAGQVMDRLNRQNSPEEYDPVPLRLLESKLVLPNEAVQSLMFTVKTYFEAASLLPDGDLNKTAILNAIMKISDLVYGKGLSALRDQEWVASLEQTLKNDLASTSGFTQGKIHLVGQSHIDIAWLWPVKETVRKVSRTFSTMCTLLDQYPQFTYTQSQPVVYEFVKTYYPELYGRIKRYIAEGRWELVGGMWVEPDLNIPSGESLVRQLLYGIRFYEREFGKRPRIEWLPDTFGYCASLPQLLVKAGLDSFMTTKMYWNDTNMFPYDLFYWEGIDGTRVLAYVCHGVNEATHPLEVKKHWDSFKQKSVHPEQMLLYGHGDGGGGVTREMIEVAKRSEDLPGLPSSTFSTARAFFDGIRAAGAKLPVWHGDMYLELHRGTYTSQARNKKWNRKAEVLYRDAEIWNSFASLYGGGSASEQLEKGWKLLLLNQFHDIVPGSSIPEVYVKSAADYREIFAIGEEVKQQALRQLEQNIDTTGDGIPVIVFNSLSWNRTEAVKISGDAGWQQLAAYDESGRRLKTDAVQTGDGKTELTVLAEDLPPMGYRTVWLRPEERRDAAKAPAFDRKWETEFYQVEWNERGEISRLYDKKAEREVLRPGETANQLQLFHDMPTSWDAWDVDPRFAEQPAAKAELVRAEVVLAGETRDVIRFQWKLSNSEIEQDVVFYHHSPRIDFETRVEWREQHKLLKAAFPVDVLASKATFEIPFGTVERATHNNTSWETAQFEVCAHRWADLSEGNYGVALMNDCKYGYDVKGNVLRLSLLRAPKWPDADADQGEHEFTYSLFPHAGGWRDAEVVRRGYELNHPVTALAAGSHAGTLPSAYSFIRTEASHVVLDTVKTAEDQDGWILRMYESGGGRERVRIRFAGEIETAEETNLLEEKQADLQVDSQTALALAVKPYEVKTIRVRAACRK